MQGYHAEVIGLVNRKQQVDPVDAHELIHRHKAGLVIQQLHAGRKRYTDILNAIPNMSARTLTKRLREFQRAGVVHRVVIPEMPVRIEYLLSTRGRELENTWRELQGWTEPWEAQERSEA